RHRAVLFEDRNGAGHVGVLLPDGDVNTIERTESFLAFVLPVDSCVIDDGIDRDGGFAGRAVTNDQLTLAAPDRNHRVNGHDTGLDRLAHGTALDDAGGDLLDRIGNFGSD